MLKPRHILGMNARVQLYTSLNPASAKRYGFSKLNAKNFLAKHEIEVPKLYARITNLEELREFEWNAVQSSFAIKPASGSAGKGIIVIKRKNKQGDTWTDVSDKEYSESDLDLHVSDILEGQYSTWGSKHMAIIEERIPIHPDLEQYAQLGTPDVRIILYNKIPVMAMARIPTEASGGRANLDLGAVGVGIDMGTGKTLYGVSGKKKLIKFFPHNDLPVSGIEIPYWEDALRVAVRTANATGLIYMGVDLFLHPEKGPMVAEVNAYPGLSIQLCNHDGLRFRLERLEGVEARNVNHAVKIGRSLFAENYSPIAGGTERPILNFQEDVVVYDDNDDAQEISAKIHTGRFRSAISEKLANKLMINQQHDLLWNQTDEDEGKVSVIEVKLKLAGRVFTTTMIVSRRLNNKPNQLELGRKDLGGYLIAGSQL